MAFDPFAAAERGEVEVLNIAQDGSYVDVRVHVPATMGLNKKRTSYIGASRTIDLATGERVSVNLYRSIPAGNRGRADLPEQVESPIRAEAARKRKAA